MSPPAGKLPVAEARDPPVIDGAIPNCHLGCALRQWLVINGEQRGFVWNDFRVDNRGLSPVLGGSGEPMTFADWYMTWLDDSIRKVRTSPCSTVAAFWRRISGRDGSG
jgi:hypothetical protein